MLETNAIKAGAKQALATSPGGDHKELTMARCWGDHLVCVILARNGAMLRSCCHHAISFTGARRSGGMLLSFLACIL